jgi:hypothetical protein
MRYSTPALLLLACLVASAMHAGEDDPYTVLSKKLENWAHENNTAAIDGVIDLDALLARIKGDTAIDDKTYQSFATGFKRGGGKLGGAVCKWAQDGSFDFLRVRADGTNRLALFRSVGEMGVNYQEMLMQRTPGGAIKIVDIRAHNTGEYFSDLLRPLFLSAIQAESPGILKRIFGDKPTLLDAMPKLQAMQQAMARQDFAGALKIYDTIPVELRTWKAAHLLRITAASKVDEKLWLNAIDDFEKAYPGDVAVKFQMIDAQLMRKNYAESLAAVNALDKAIGTDVYLNILRANVYREWGKPVEAEAAAQKVVDNLPPRDDSYTTLLLCQVSNKKHAAAVKTLDLFEEHLSGVNQDFLATEPTCAEFVKSPEYKAWQAKQKK